MDSNHRMSESESDALPLGDTPAFLNADKIILKIAYSVKQILFTIISKER